VRRPAANAQLALLLEVAGTPKPGNVDRTHDYPDLRFEHFLAGAVGARDGLDALADPEIPLGAAFERAVAGMSEQTGGNTQFGAILLLAPLVRAATRDGDLLENASDVAAETTVRDAIGFYAAFEHVDVSVPERPRSGPLPDVRRGRDAAADLRTAGLTLADVMAGSADHDGIAAEWVDGFPRTAAVAERIADATGSVTHRAARVYLEQLAAEPDTFVVTQHDQETAREVRDRAAALLDGGDVAGFADDLVDRGINPGTTADVVAGGLFRALDAGLEV
jgi:triphosphoribosyl-dephospho-CoA synthase